MGEWSVTRVDFRVENRDENTLMKRTGRRAPTRPRELTVNVKPARYRERGCGGLGGTSLPACLILTVPRRR